MIAPEAGIVDLYLSRVDALPVPLSKLRLLLSGAEEERIARFHREIDRERQSAAAGLLRWVLAERLGCDAASLEFMRNEHGKPYLAGGPAFNLSHSGEWILIGVAAAGRLGVDIEAVRPLHDLEGLARCNFAPDEVSALLATAPDERQRAFYRAWTRKEAYLKALGRGLTLPLDSFSVSLHPSPRRALLRTDDPSELPSRWSVQSVRAAPDAEVAVAWDRPGCRTRLHGPEAHAPPPTSCPPDPAGLHRAPIRQPG